MPKTEKSSSTLPDTLQGKVLDLNQDFASIDKSRRKFLKHVDKSILARLREKKALLKEVIKQNRAIESLVDQSLAQIKPGPVSLNFLPFDKISEILSLSASAVAGQTPDDYSRSKITFTNARIEAFLLGNSESSQMAAFIAAHTRSIGGQVFLVAAKGTQEESVFLGTKLIANAYAGKVKVFGQTKGFAYPGSLYDPWFYSVVAPEGFLAVFVAAPDLRDPDVTKYFQEDRAKFTKTMYATYRSGYEYAIQGSKKIVVGTFLGAQAFEHNRWLAAAIAYDVALEYAKRIAINFVDCSLEMQEIFTAVRKMSGAQRKDIIEKAGIARKDEAATKEQLGQIAVAGASTSASEQGAPPASSVGAAAAAASAHLSAPASVFGVWQRPVKPSTAQHRTEDGIELSAERDAALRAPQPTK